VKRAPAKAIRQHAGARTSRLRAAHSYRFVLLMIFISFAFIALAPDTDWSRSIVVFIQSATLVVALWTSGMTKYARGSLILVGLAVLAALGLILNPSDTILGLVGIFELLLTLGIATTVGLGVIDQGEINAQSVMGAICIYFLLGLIFTFVYGSVAALDSAPFFSQGTDGTFSVRMYFSYVTLSTVGYGDYSTASNLGHLLAVSEALLGQLYLVTVVAVLVSRIRPRGGTE
jgi:Ion channel